MFDSSFYHRTAHGARRTAEAFGQTAFAAFAVIALIAGFCTLTFADRASAQQLPPVFHTAKSGGFADFRKQQQARLLSAIDNTLATQAEDAITGNFAAVRKAEVQVQTKLGGRKGNIGVNLVGSFDDADNRAFGWQLRAYGGEDDARGANAGVFYRKIDKGALFGVNAFLDYEDGDYGDFSRFGFGGEVQHIFANFAANYYLPLTDGRNVNSTLAAFSREGFDAKLRINAMDFAAVRLAANYYNFDGKRGAASDDGLRYGVELTPIPALHLGVFYDEGAKRYGGNVVYAHTIGEVQARKDGENFAPDMFAAISREYSQRIVTVAKGPAVSITAMTMTTFMTAAAITTTITMTAASVTTTMTMEMQTITNTRRASVHFLSRVTPGAVQGGFVVISTNVKRVLTLPPDDGARPITLNVSRDWRNEPGYTTDANAFRIVQRGNVPAGNINLPHGSNWRYLGGSRQLFVTIVEGSEEFIDLTITPETETPMTMAGAITETPMTMAAITTTTRTTTFITMTIMLTANAAMGDISPSNSRFRGNDEKGGNYAMGGNDEGGDNKTPSIPPPSNMPKMAMSKPPFQYHRHSRD